MTADGWISDPNGDGWYWIKRYVRSGPRYVRYFGRGWYGGDEMTEEHWIWIEVAGIGVVTVLMCVMAWNGRTY